MTDSAAPWKGAVTAAAVAVLLQLYISAATWYSSTEAAASR